MKTLWLGIVMRRSKKRHSYASRCLIRRASHVWIFRLCAVTTHTHTRYTHAHWSLPKRIQVAIDGLLETSSSSVLPLLSDLDSET